MDWVIVGGFIALVAITVTTAVQGLRTPKNTHATLLSNVFYEVPTKHDSCWHDPNFKGFVNAEGVAVGTLMPQDDGYLYEFSLPTGTKVKVWKCRYNALTVEFRCMSGTVCHVSGCRNRLGVPVWLGLTKPCVPQCQTLEAYLKTLTLL